MTPTKATPETVPADSSLAIQFYLKSLVDGIQELIVQTQTTNNAIADAVADLQTSLLAVEDDILATNQKILANSAEQLKYMGMNHNRIVE